MNRINVLYLIRTWALGGSHTIVLHLLKHLPRDRFNIVCVPYDTASHSDDAFIELLRKNGLEVAEERIPWHERSNWFRARDMISALIKTYQIDLLHTHDPQSVVLAGLGRKRWPCACVASEYGYWRRLFPLRSHVYTFVEQYMALPAYERVITVSEDMKRQILAGGTRKSRLRIVRTGLDLDMLQTPSTRETMRNHLGIPEDACVVGTVGRIYFEKGHAYLIMAVAGLAGIYPNVRLLVVGTGPLLPGLRALAIKLGIEDRVIFTGYFEDLAGALSAMDVFALTSILEEGFPTVLLEAQAMGLPVVASDIGGTPETIDPGRTGLLAPPKDVQALMNALGQLLGDPERRRTMGDAARVWLRDTFTLEAMISGVSAVYEEALAEYRGTP